MNKSLCFACLLALGASSPVFSATLLNLDFDTTEGTWAVTGDGGTRYATGTDSANLFGLGTSNVMATYRDQSGASSRTISTAFVPEGNTPLTLTMDLYILSQNGSSAAAFGFYSGALTDAPVNAARLAGGNLLNLNVGTPYKVTFYYNNSTSDLDYYNPVTDTITSLAVGAGAFFAYDVNNATWTNISVGGASTSSISRISFYNNAAGQSVIHFDNILITDNPFPTIPEPSTFAILGGATALGLAALRKRRK